MHLPNPVIRSHYRNGFIKQYVRDHLILRIEAATNNVTDYGVNKAVENLPALRDKIAAISVLRPLPVSVPYPANCHTRNPYNRLPGLGAYHAGLNSSKSFPKEF
jgi:hypothetical protein